MSDAIRRALEACGMKKTLPPKGPFVWSGAPPLSMGDIKEFPSVGVQVVGTRTRLGEPMIIDLEVTGTPDELEAFKEKFGIRWDGKAWVKG